MKWIVMKRVPTLTSSIPNSYKVSSCEVGILTSSMLSVSRCLSLMAVSCVALSTARTCALDACEASCALTWDKKLKRKYKGKYKR